MNSRYSDGRTFDHNAATARHKCHVSAQFNQTVSPFLNQHLQINWASCKRSHSGTQSVGFEVFRSFLSLNHLNCYRSRVSKASRLPGNRVKGTLLNYLFSSLALARRSSLVPSWGISLWS